MINSKPQFELFKHLRQFTAKKNDSWKNPMFQCVLYTGEYAVATNTHVLAMIPSKVPAMLQNIYTGELSTATFPDFKRVIPDQFVCTVNLPAVKVDGLIRTLEAAMEFLTKLDEHSDVRLQAENGIITVSWKDIESKASASVQIPTDDITGAIDAHFCSKYLRSALITATAYNQTGAPICLQFAGHVSPMIVSVNELKILITPLRRGDD